MSEAGTGRDDILRRPIGWWLKAADARINAAFDRALAGTGVDRRRWQVLTMLAHRPATLGEVEAALGDFDDPSTVESIVGDLVRRDWVYRDGELRLTDHGAAVHRAVAPRVDAVRQAVVDALPGDDYVALVRLLSRLVAHLEAVANR